ncbi:MAG: PQ-loop repeat-containing protein [Deltaproteobacteria bacterium]|nr:PQ-loop repeat-containing protein [Deltaproteobacteria bacterium]
MTVRSDCSLFAAIVGWASSAILCGTLIAQVYKQWKAKRAAGVSPWLYVGQTATSAGFVTYSALRGDMVFIVTNSVLLVVALVGVWIDRRSHKT